MAVTVEDFFKVYYNINRFVNKVFENSGATNIELVNFGQVLFTVRITVRYTISGEEKTAIIKVAESCLDSGKNWNKAIERNKKQYLNQI